MGVRSVGSMTRATDEVRSSRHTEEKASGEAVFLSNSSRRIRNASDLTPQDAGHANVQTEHGAIKSWEDPIFGTVDTAAWCLADSHQ